MEGDNRDQQDAQSVDAIRDILFGRQMHDYEQRFAALERRLQAELAALEERTGSGRAELITSFTEQIDNLQRNTIGRSDLATLLREMADRLDAG